MEDCILRDTMRVFVVDDDQMLEMDTIVCSDESILLSSSIPGKYLWSDESESESLVVHNEGVYSLTVTNQCGEFEYVTNVEHVDCDCRVYIPNVFSPNGDGLNDYLELFVDCDFESHILSFQVFNRWGSLIYMTQGDEEVLWDGSKKGDPLESGVYVWLLEYEVTRNGETSRIIKKGDLTLVR